MPTTFRQKKNAQTTSRHKSTRYVILIAKWHVHNINLQLCYWRYKDINSLFDTHEMTTPIEVLNTYSKTSITRTFRLPWMIWTFSSVNSRKQVFRDIFLYCHENLCWVYSLESPHWGDSNEYTQLTIIVLKIKKTSLNYRHLLPGSNFPCLE